METNKLKVIGKFLSDFEEWYYKQEYAPMEFEYLHLDFQYGVFKAFADSKEYCINASRYTYNIIDNNNVGLELNEIIISLEQSQIACINKLVEIYNEK